MKIRLIISLIAVLFNLSCNKDFLEEKPRSVLTPTGFYTEEAGLEAGLNSTYAALRPIYGENEAPFRLTLLGTDLFTFGKAEVGLPFDYYDVDLNSFSEEVAFIWENSYKIVNSANVVIASAPQVEMDDEKRKKIISEAKVLRALSYYWLAQQFGDVPLRLEPTQGIDVNVTRAAESEVYAAIIKDLNYSIEHLDRQSSEWGRVTKVAAQHLLSKIYLLTENWDEAAILAKEVINKSDHRLLENFNSIFDSENQINDEIIFSVQYEADFINSGEGNKTHLYFTNSYSDIPGMKRVLEWGRPWTRYAPTPYLMNLYNDQKDKRIDIWRTFDDFYYNDESSLPDGKNLGDPIDSIWRNTIEFHPALIKYWDPSRISANDTRGNKDFIVFRLGEAYLIAAEALLMANKSSEALIYFNTLRQRAARTGVNFNITESELDLDMILDERARELSGEMHRWFDLKRMNKSLERIKAHSAHGQNIQEFHLLRPLPQNDIDLLETPIEQNPGY